MGSSRLSHTFYIAWLIEPKYPYNTTALVHFKRKIHRMSMIHASFNPQLTASCINALVKVHEIQRNIISA